MKKQINLIFLLAGMAFATTVQAQGINTPAKSPASSIKQALGIGEVNIDYFRPSKNGRKIFGDLVPFGEVWRTGANQSTKIDFSDDITINGKSLKAGKYALYTIPGENEWTIIFSNNLKLWGSFGYKQEEDALRISAKPQKTAGTTESFTIQFSNLKPTSAALELMWENTLVSLDLSVSVDETIMKNIDETMKEDKRPFFDAAEYYYENKKDMKQALEWANKAFELEPKAYWVALLKARIQLELKDNKGAASTAGTAAKLAQEAEDPAYEKQANEVIEQAKKAK